MSATAGGSVLEEQADSGPGVDLPPDIPTIDHEAAFEAGLALLRGSTGWARPMRSRTPI